MNTLNKLAHAVRALWPALRTWRALSSALRTWRALSSALRTWRALSSALRTWRALSLAVRAGRALGSLLAAGAVLTLAPLPVAAETSVVSPSGFVSSFRAEIVSTPDAAWKAVIALPRWWNPQHSWSGKADNLSLDAQAGGCFCERWTDAAGAAQSVQHGQVVLVQTGRVIRLFAALGPLQELAVNGVLTIVSSAGLGPEAGKNFLRMTYRVSGGADTGLDKLAPAVDGVIGEQFKRLKSLIETGKSE